MSRAVTKLARSHKTRNVYFLVAAAVIMISVLVYRQDQKPQTINQIMAAVKEQTHKTYSNIHINDTTWPSEMGAGVSLVVPGYDYKINSKAMPSLYFSYTDNQSSRTERRFFISNKRIPPANDYDIGRVADAIKPVMRNADFVAVPAANLSYQKGDTKCVYTAENGAGVFSCYEPQAVSEAARTAKPFIDALIKADANRQSSEITFGPVVIKSKDGAGVVTSSHEAGYDIAEALITSGSSKQLILYYNKDGGPWQYAATANDEYGFRCGDFMASPDARKAFYDQICLSENGHVRLDTENRALQ